MAPKATKPAATPAPAAPTASGAPAASGAAKTNKPRVAPELTDVSSAVTMPVKSSNRGSKSLYPFGKLEIGQSFGVVNKTAASMASIVSNQNRKHRVEKRDEHGNVVYETKELKGQDGTITHVPTDKPVIVVEKHFFADDCNAKDDPDGASVRVWRDK